MLTSLTANSDVGQGGYGRGGRMKIEVDAATILTGVRNGVSIGAPLALHIPNRDFRIDEAPEINRPRPGHADLAGSLKWLTTDCRETLERASARETAARVAAGGVAKCLLREFGVQCVGYVLSIGTATATVADDADADSLKSARDNNDVYTPDAAAVQPMIEQIKAAKRDRDTAGGVVEVRVLGLPVGLGSCFSGPGRLGRASDGRGRIRSRPSRVPRSA